MEPIIKLEKNDDEEEFQSILTIEETKLTDVNLKNEERITKRNYSPITEGRSFKTEDLTSDNIRPKEEKHILPETKLIDGTSIKTEHVACSELSPEVERQTLYKKSNTNESELLDTNLIYSPPFFKIIHQLGPEKDTYVARCYSCGRLMKSSAKQASILVQHMKSFHQEIAKIYEKYKQDKLEKSSVSKPIEASVSEASKNCTSVKVNTNCSKVDDECLEAIARTVENDKNNEDVIIEIIIDDDNQQEINNETTSNQNPGNDENSQEFSSTALKKLGNIINQRIENFVTETGFKELNDKVDNSLMSSAKYNQSIIEELKSELNKLKRECKDLHLSVLQIQASKMKLQNKALKMKKNYIQQRRLNIKNMKINNRQQPLKDVEKLFKDILSLGNINIVKCSITPVSQSSVSSKTSTVNEIVSVEFLHAKDCKLVLSQQHKLKDAGIYIERELKPLQRKRQNKLMILHKELLSRKPDLKIFIHKTMLVINDKTFYWDDIEGLYHKEPEAMQSTGVEYLNSITGLDLKEFISFLQKYEMNVNKI